MLLTCPQCKTVFRIDNTALAPEGQQVRCSVCAHIWSVSAPSISFQAERSNLNDTLLVNFESLAPADLAQ